MTGWLVEPITVPVCGGGVGVGCGGGWVAWGVGDGWVALVGAGCGLDVFPGVGFGCVPCCVVPCVAGVVACPCVDVVDVVDKPIGFVL